MKIAYLSTFYPYRGGIAQFNAALYRALQKQHEISVYNFSRQYPDLLFPGKTQYVTAQDNADPIESMRTLDTVNPLSWFRTANLIKDEQPDLLLMRYWTSFLAPSLGVVGSSVKSEKTKVISIIDNALPHERTFMDKSFARYFLNRNDAFVAMSEAVKQDILELKPNANILLREHPLYSHFGSIIDRNAALEKLKIPKDKKNILFFGFIRDYKGLDILLEAFRNLDDTYQLIIAGENYGSFEKYQNIIDQLPNKHSVYSHIRYINDSEVPVFFGAADVVCLPYRSATQSGITAIAFHFEKPVIATNVGGLKETIDNEKTGLIVDEPKPDAITKAIRHFFTQSQAAWKSEMALLKQQRSWEKFAQDLISFSQNQ